MQINCQTSELTGPALVPEVSPTLPRGAGQRRTTASASSLLSLRAECRRLVRTQALEDLAWAAIALSSLALLAVSLCF